MVKCFVTGCSIGFLRCKEKTTKFRAPRDEKQFILWQKAIPRSEERGSVEEKQSTTSVKKIIENVNYSSRNQNAASVCLYLRHYFL
jgi:hypothetical protein